MEPTRRPRRVFSDEFKAETVELIRSSGRSVSEVAKELDLTRTAVAEWVRNAEAEDGSRPRLKPDEVEELKRLRKENRLLKMERDLLKKAAAFFAKDSGETR